MQKGKWGFIILGLAIFVIGITFPFWYGKGRSTPCLLYTSDAADE